MKKIIYGITLIFVMAFCLYGCSDESVTQDQPEITAYLLEPGEVFEPGGYIEIENVQILYDGENFTIQNNREDIIRVSSCIVGVKRDGTYDPLQWPAFGGVDKAKYEKDLEENGWAVERGTNMVRPGESLVATMTIFDFGSDYPDPDIDKDGYYDVVFTISPQTDEGAVSASTDDPESEIYKLKVK
jgi:hypothetical protein